MNKTQRRLTVQRFKLLMDLGAWLGSYRHPEIEKKYQKRDKSQDPVNQHDETLDWLPNDYPYYWQKGIEHWILWYHGDWETLEENYQEWILKFTKTYVLAWINPPHLQSINSFPHCHVLLWNGMLTRKNCCQEYKKMVLENNKTIKRNAGTVYLDRTEMKRVLSWLENNTKQIVNCLHCSDKFKIISQSAYSVPTSALPKEWSKK